MLDAGLITEEDYDAVKREVLRLTDVHQTHPPPPIVVGLAAEPAVSTIISVSSNARLNKSRLVCSPDWLTLQLVESDAISSPQLPRSRIGMRSTPEVRRAPIR